MADTHRTLNRSVNDRPLFMQNRHRCSISDTQEISEFRRALPQFLAVSVKNILLFVYGMTLGFPTIVIPAIQGGDGREPSDIVLNRDQISWFSSINLICVPLGCLFSGALTQPFGKRKAMQIVNLPILASWLLFHFATRTEHLYAALCLSGLGGGLMEAAVLTYVAEITEPKYRGILSALGSTCVILGVFIQFIMGSFMDWRTIAAVSSAFPVICIVALCFIPESPTWLIREQRFREAVKSLQWLRGWVSEHKIESEFNRLYDELITQPAFEEAEENGPVKPTKCASRIRMFRKRSFLVPFLLVAFTFFTGHFSGKTPLQTYAVQIFHTLKAPINKYHATILLGVAELIATVLCVFLIHFTGKRPLVLISTIGVGFCFFGTATYAHYLKIVPGFAVNNVVINASSIVAKENIISGDNITQIFEKEEKALLLATKSLEAPNSKYDQSNSTDTVEDFTTILPVIEYNRTKREEAVLENYELYGNESNNKNLTFLELPLDYGEANDTNKNVSYVLDDFDSGEDNTTVKNTSNLKQFEAAIISGNATNNRAEKLPSTNEVVNEILLPVPKQEKNRLVWLPLILLLGSAFFAHCGIRMIPWILIGEVFPAPVRSTASGLVSGVGYIFGFLANKLFLQMLTTLTMPGTFWFYSGVAFLGAVVLYFILPETEGRTLGEIEAHFSKKSKTNLLSKDWQNNNKISITQMDNLQNLQIAMDRQTQTKVLQLQQSDFIPSEATMGKTNLAYEENNTTHL
ncbi:facilitated trehalose transporter Tret1 isoform X2 [Teleopsis dalmanni]|uniref:facilitated trehalose transporter Tret1 isoform X2 n=1 Tax=Teleopsis dalmanni TaxID=139649 RepID=UPI0018CCAEEA|nr:facilitated trehalose transporter Tret1 isoform X2 [Teleopsis dalmanni]XP_037947940.1 facilitated trehalose transporter Tret1 isoform X2 [Teleopsis dalmanni]